MKLKNIGPTQKLEFNDLGKVTKGVSPQDQFVALKPGDSVYLPDSGEVMFSAKSGDAARYAAHGLLQVNETLTIAAGASAVIVHNFGYLPSITVALSANGWKDLSFTDGIVEVVTNVALKETTITNPGVAAITVMVRIS